MSDNLMQCFMTTEPDWNRIRLQWESELCWFELLYSPKRKPRLTIGLTNARGDEIVAYQQALGEVVDFYRKYPTFAAMKAQCEAWGIWELGRWEVFSKIKET